MVAAEDEKEEVEKVPSAGAARPNGGAGEDAVASSTLAWLTEKEDPAADPEEAKASKLDLVQSCLEELLSKQNLAEDAFIQQHMNAQMYIPLCILAGHHRISRLGGGVDVAALLEAAGRSDKLGVDEEQLLVRPMLKPKRNTLILHDLPETVAEQELQDLFKDSPEGASLCSVKPDVNRTAFVSFQSDEAAQRAALWLRSQTLHGSSVKCAVKAEHFLRSFFPATPASPPSGMTMAPYGPSGQQVVWAQMSAWPGQWQGTGAGAAQYGTSYEMWADAGVDSAGAAWPQSGEAKDGGAKGHGGKGKGKGKGKWKGKRKGEGLPPSAEEMGQMEAMSAQRIQKSPSMRMRADSFAPIQEPVAPGEGDQLVDDSELGYTHDFRKYSREEIIEVCSGMDELTKPESFTRFEREEKDVTLFRQSPYKDWAPLPTPQITFASGVFSGEGRRSTESSIPGSPLVEGLGGRPLGKGSAMSRSSWSSSRRSRSTSRGRLESGEPEDWTANAAAWENAEWEEWAGDAAWSKGTESSSRWRWRSSSWNDWYSSGQQWVEKQPTAAPAASQDQATAAATTAQDKGEEAEKKEQWGPKRMSWAEKVKESTRERSVSIGATQKWKAKTKPEAAEAQKEEGSVQVQKEKESVTEQKEGVKEDVKEEKAAVEGVSTQEEAAAATGTTRGMDDRKGAEAVAGSTTAAPPVAAAEPLAAAAKPPAAAANPPAAAAKPTVPAAEPAASAAEPAATAAEPPAAAAEPSAEAAEPAPTPKRAPTWADKVRMGGSPKAASKAASK